MNQGIFMCKMCGHRTHDKTLPHSCGSITAVIHEENNFKPRSAVDALFGMCITDIKRNIGLAFEHHPDEMEKIHPQMLVSLLITNTALNLFMDIYNSNATHNERREAMSELMDKVKKLTIEGLDALIATTADTTKTH